MGTSWDTLQPAQGTHECHFLIYQLQRRVDNFIRKIAKIVLFYINLLSYNQNSHGNNRLVTEKRKLEPQKQTAVTAYF